MTAIASTLCDIAMTTVALVIWIGVVIACRDFFYSAPRPRKAEDGYAVMPAAEREFFTTTTHKTSPRRVERPGS